MSVKNIIIRLVDKVPFGLRKNIKNIPGLKQLQSFLLKKWVNNYAFNATISGGPAKGLVFPVQMPQDKLMWVGTWEIEFANELSNSIKPGWVCYDIGAYKGYYAGIMALRGAAEVIIFEPLPSNIERVKKLVELNKHLNMRVEEVAVSDKTGLATFNIMADKTMGKLAFSDFEKGESGIQKLDVHTISLDELIEKGIPEPDFVKIDVEGVEELVLKGAIKLMQRKKPVLMIEIHSIEIGKRCMELLKKYYRSVTVFEKDFPQPDDAREICHYIARD